MVPLKSLHSFHLDAHAKDMFPIRSQQQLLDFVASQDVSNVLILGQGSNSVFVEDYPGPVMLIELKGIHVDQQLDDYVLNVAAGEDWHQLVQWCMEKGIYGLENLAFIPGTVGAAPIQNIGAYGVEIKRFIDYVMFFDFALGEVRKLSCEQCQFSYRNSVFKQALAGKGVIIEVVLRLPKMWQGVTNYGELAQLEQPSAEDIFNKVISIRQAKLPNPDDLGNAGSFFKNPVIQRRHFARLQQQWPEMPYYPVSEQEVKVPAAWLIDRLGFKGKTRGGIRCHPTQPLVLTNIGGGTGQELLMLAREIKNDVKKTFDVCLENEVRLIGSNGLVTL